MIVTRRVCTCMPRKQCGWLLRFSPEFGLWFCLTRTVFSAAIILSRLSLRICRPLIHFLSFFIHVQCVLSPKLFLGQKTITYGPVLPVSPSTLTSLAGGCRICTGGNLVNYDELIKSIFVSREFDVVALRNRVLCRILQVVADYMRSRTTVLVMNNKS